MLVLSYKLYDLIFIIFGQLSVFLSGPCADAHFLLPNPLRLFEPVEISHFDLCSIFRCG